MIEIVWSNMGLNGIINGTAIPSSVTSLYLDDNANMGFIPHTLPSELFLFSAYGKPYVWHPNLPDSLQIITRISRIPW